VTGAARGIGRATAEALAREGASVALFDIADPAAITSSTGYRLANASELDEAFRSVQQFGRALRFQGDVRSLESLKSAMKETVAQFGGLDIVVANAGYVAWHTVENGTEQQVDDVMQVNIAGVWKTIHAAVPHLKARGGGRIITISSIGGRIGAAGNGIYTPTKWAVIGMTKQAAQELGPYNIAVNSVAPGPVNTPMYRSEGQLRSMGMKTFAEQDNALNAVMPLGESPALAPADIADSVVFLAGARAKTISGTVIDVALGFNASYTG
jgi:NAD(P)-dependent dehydrogenase (short-subunit alcohol dehydrogenase family)